MALVVCTPGGPTDNSYCTWLQANGYWAATLQADEWAQFAKAQQELALVQATRVLENACGGARISERSCQRSRFVGAPYQRDLDSQALHFPRTQDVDDDLSGTGAIVLVIPEAVQAATCEQALWLLQRMANKPPIDHETIRADGVRFWYADGVGFTYGTSNVPTDVAPAAYGLLRPYIVRGLPTVSGRPQGVMRHGR